jgi:hypothetical protein
MHRIREIEGLDDPFRSMISRRHEIEEPQE